MNQIRMKQIALQDYNGSFEWKQFEFQIFVENKLWNIQ